MTTEPKHTPLLPVEVFAGTILHDANGKTLFCACEEGELRGGSHDSIRETLKLAAKCINEAPALLADNERLREALRNLVRLHGEQVFINGEDDNETVRDVLLQAEAALSAPSLAHEMRFRRERNASVLHPVATPFDLPDWKTLKVYENQ